MDDKVGTTLVNMLPTFENNDGHYELDEEVEQLVITEEKGEVGHDMDKVPVIKKCFNGLHHESTKEKQEKVKRNVKPIPGYDIKYYHFTKEQDKRICVDSTNGDWIRVEDVPVEQHEENQHNEEYTDFFKASIDGDGVLRNNKFTGKDEWKLQVGIKS